MDSEEEVQRKLRLCAKLKVRPYWTDEDVDTCLFTVRQELQHLRGLVNEYQNKLKYLEQQNIYHKQYCSVQKNVVDLKNLLQEWGDQHEQVVADQEREATYLGEGKYEADAMEEEEKEGDTEPASNTEDAVIPAASNTEDGATNIEDPQIPGRSRSRSRDGWNAEDRQSQSRSRSRSRDGSNSANDEAVDKAARRAITSIRQTHERVHREVKVSNNNNNHATREVRGYKPTSTGNNNDNHAIREVRGYKPTSTGKLRTRDQCRARAMADLRQAKARGIIIFEQHEILSYIIYQIVQVIL